MTWRMPAETAPQERVWMAFPRVGNTLGDDAASADEARDAWAAVAQRRRRVRAGDDGRRPVGASPRPDAGCRGEIELVEAPLDDFWMRDIGPTFVLDDERRARRGRLDLQRLGRERLGDVGARRPRSPGSSPSSRAPSTCPRRS